jgi:hypothetical protein
MITAMQGIRGRFATLAVVAGLTGVAVPGDAWAQALDAALLKCQRSITKEATKASGAAAKVYRKVLDAGIQDYYASPEISEKTAESVATTLRKLSDPRDLGSSIEEKTEARIVSACDPATHPFTNEDLLGLPGATAVVPLNGKALEGLSATTLGAPGTIDSVNDLAKTITRIAVTEVVKPVFASAPNGIAVLEATKTKIESLPIPPEDVTKHVDAIGILDSAKYLVDSDDDGLIDPKILVVDVPSTTSTTSSTSSTTTTTIFVPNVCGNGVWEPGAGEQCDPTSPQAGGDCQSDCTCAGFGVCNYF